MSRFEALLRKYREQTACDPADSLELNVLARLRNEASDSLQTNLSKPSVRPAAATVGLLVGLLAVAAPPFAAGAEGPIPELTVFAPDAPQLLSTWMGRPQ
jgi:hypothetical protein